MAKKLSDLLSALASKTKSVENKIEKAREESGEKLDKRIEESKAELQRKKDEFISHAEEINTKTKDGWDFFKTSVNQKIEHIKAEAVETKENIHKKIKDKRHELTVESANDNIIIPWIMRLVVLNGRLWLFLKWKVQHWNHSLQNKNWLP